MGLSRMFERFTNEARNLVVAAQDEARGLGHRYIGTEHLLLALLRPESGGPAILLRDAGVTRERVVADLEKALGPAGHLSSTDAAALEAIGIDLDAVRSKLEETFGPGALDPLPPPRKRGLFRHPAPQPPRSGHLPFTPRSKKVLELSLREALRLKDKVIGSEHILLGLLRENEGLGTKILADAGVDFADLRRQVETSLRPAA
jgi:ATP-dependent Clp protease ATP-binding subunit ClpA